MIQFYNKLSLYIITMAEDCLNYLSNSDKVRMMPGTEDKFIKNICNDLVDVNVPLSEQLRDLMSKTILKALRKPTNINEIGNTVVRNVFNNTLNVINGPLLLNSLIKNGKGDSDDVRLKIVKIFKNIFSQGMTLKQFLIAFKSTISNESGIFKLEQDEMKGGNCTMKKKRKKKRRGKTFKNKIKGGGKTSKEIINEIKEYQEKLKNMRQSTSTTAPTLEEQENDRQLLKQIDELRDERNIAEKAEKEAEEKRKEEEKEAKKKRPENVQKKLQDEYDNTEWEIEHVGEGKFDTLRTLVGTKTNKEKKREGNEKLLDLAIQKNKSIADNRSGFEYVQDAYTDAKAGKLELDGLTLEEKRKKIYRSNLSAKTKQELLEKARSSQIMDEKQEKLEKISSQEQRGSFLGKITGSNNSGKLQKEREEVLKDINDSNILTSSQKEEFNKNENERKKESRNRRLQEIDTQEKNLNTGLLGKLSGSDNKKKNLEVERRKTQDEIIDARTDLSTSQKDDLKQKEARKQEISKMDESIDQLKASKGKVGNNFSDMFRSRDSIDNERAQIDSQIDTQTSERYKAISEGKTDFERATDGVTDLLKNKNFTGTNEEIKKQIEDSNLSAAKKNELLANNKTQQKQKTRDESLQKIEDQKKQLNENKRKGMLETVLGNAGTDKKLANLEEDEKQLRQEKKRDEVANRSEFQKAMDSFSDSRVSNDASNIDARFASEAAKNTDVTNEAFEKSLDKSGYSEAKKQELMNNRKELLDADKAKNPEKRSVSDAMQGLKGNFEEAAGKATTGAQDLLAKAFGATTPSESTPEQKEEEKKKREAAGITDGPGETKMDLNQMIQELYNEYNTEILDLFTKRIPFLEMLLFEKILNATYVHSKENSDVILGSIKDALKGALRKNNVIKKSDDFIFIHALNGSYHYIRKSLKYVYDKQIEENQKEIMSQNENKLGTIENIPFDPTNENFVDEFIIYFLSLSDVKIFDKIKKPKKKKEEKKEEEHDEEYYKNTPLELM